MTGYAASEHIRAPAVMSRGHTGPTDAVHTVIARATTPSQSLIVSKQRNLPTGGLGPDLSREHNARQVAPSPVIACIECKKNRAFALYECRELIFTHIRIVHKLLCAECGFTLHAKRRVIYPEEGRPYSVQRYDSISLTMLVEDMRQ